MKRDKVIIIIIASCLIILIGFLWYNNKRKNITFTLIGDETVEVEYNDSYIDPGFEALNGFNKDISNHVKTVGEIDTTKIGNYTIEYVLEYAGITKSLTRYVEIINTKIENFDIVLYGDETIYLPLDEEYTEYNGYVLDKTTNKKMENALKIINNVDNNKIGEYDVIYQFSYMKKKKEIQRKVIVYNIQKDYVLDSLNSNNINITINIQGLNNYQYAKINGTDQTSNTLISYTANKNNNDKLTIYLKDGNELNITMQDLYSNKYSCSGIINRSGTTLSLNNTSNIKKYEWNNDGTKENGNSPYNIYKSVKNSSVKLTLDNNDTYTLPCTVTDQLSYHFVYDEKNTKPYMKCNTYTSEQRIELDAKLKKVILEAGFGTRAGVVEAARFMVGAMDHKIPYLGPKKDVDASLGKYFYKGLNIGKKGAWGCNVSGWIQGLDCTNFVEWAFYQNDIRTGAFKSEHSEIINVIDKVRVGDLVYTPENVSKDKCRNKTCLDHVGIIIGIDDNYLYIAEQTAWGTRVNKKDKNNLPKQGEEFSLVHFYNYTEDGNLTSMWLE